MRKYLIHLLGGVTQEELSRKIASAVHGTQYVTLNCVKHVMDGQYGKPLEEWSTAVYDYVVYQLEDMRA